VYETQSEGLESPGYEAPPITIGAVYSSTDILLATGRESTALWQAAPRPGPRCNGACDGAEADGDVSAAYEALWLGSVDWAGRQIISVIIIIEVYMVLHHQPLVDYLGITKSSMSLLVQSVCPLGSLRFGGFGRPPGGGLWLYNLLKRPEEAAGEDSRACSGAECAVS